MLAEAEIWRAAKRGGALFGAGAGCGCGCGRVSMWSVEQHEKSGAVRLALASTDDVKGLFLSQARAHASEVYPGGGDERFPRRRVPKPFARSIAVRGYCSGACAKCVLFLPSPLVVAAGGTQDAQLHCSESLINSPSPIAISGSTVPLTRTTRNSPPSPALRIRPTTPRFRHAARGIHHSSRAAHARQDEASGVKPPATLHAAPFASLVRQSLVATSRACSLPLHIQVSRPARQQSSSVTNGNIALPPSRARLKQCSMTCSLQARTRATTTTPR